MHFVNKVIVGTMVATTTVQLAVNAQYGQAKKSPPTPVKQLAAPQLLPDVPQYTGQARFMSGEKTESNDGDGSIRQTWHIREGRAEAVGWYKTALTNAGWRIGAATKGTLTGSRDDGTIMVIVNEIPLADHYKSELMIQYYRAQKK